jgi:hypothetical protein
MMIVTNTNGTGAGTYQDFLYIANATYTSPVVPEPATFLLWTLGGVGIFGMNRYRTRNKNPRLALA